MRQALPAHLLDPLAMKLLDGEIKAGDRVLVGAEAGGLTFRVGK